MEDDRKLSPSKANAPTKEYGPPFTLNYIPCAPPSSTTDRHYGASRSSFRCFFLASELHEVQLCCRRKSEETKDAIASRAFGSKSSLERSRGVMAMFVQKVPQTRPASPKPTTKTLVSNTEENVWRLRM